MCTATDNQLGDAFGMPQTAHALCRTTHSTFAAYMKEMGKSNSFSMSNPADGDGISPAQEIAKLRWGAPSLPSPCGRQRCSWKPLQVSILHLLLPNAIAAQNLDASKELCPDDFSEARRCHSLGFLVSFLFWGQAVTTFCSVWVESQNHRMA